MKSSRKDVTLSIQAMKNLGIKVVEEPVSPLALDMKIGKYLIFLPSSPAMYVLR